MERKCYDNCKISTASGFFIGFCNKKKMEWYLKMGLATKDAEDSIKLNFEPNIKKEKTEIDKFRDTSIRAKKNICVACGSTENISVHSTVPAEMKKYYPRELKSHRSDLIVSLCTECKFDAQYFDSVLLEDILKEYGYTKKDLSDPDKIRLRAAALHVKKGRYVKECDREIVANYIGESEMENVTKIEELSKIEIWRLVDGLTIYNYIMNKIIENGELIKFENRCIEHFYKMMNPVDLPQDIIDRIKRN